MQETLYLNREDAKSVEEEERDLFVKAILAELDLPGLDEIWADEHLESVEKKIELKRLLAKYNIEILEQDRSVEIYVERELIAIWRKPRFRLLTDMKQISPSKKLFYEMTIDCESIFDEQEEEEQE